jgi:protein-S-isoprenylcysteine O-methyltransferase Ste14
MQAQLLRTLEYVWMAFGVYWASFSLLKGAPGDARGKGAQKFRFGLLAAGFVFLFVERHRLPPSLLIVLALIWAAVSLRWAAHSRSVQTSGEFPLYRLLRLCVLAVTFALLFWDRTAIGVLGERFVAPLPAVAVTGFTLALIGLSIAMWARVHLGQYWSDKVVLKVDHQLIRAGPYAHMRHPIYSGVLLAVLGTALVVAEWRGLLAFLVLLINYWIKAKREEQILSAQFNEEFRDHEIRAGFLLPRFRARS